MIKDFRKAKRWAGIICVLEHNNYLSIGLTVNYAENVAQQCGLTWKEMTEVLNHAHKNVDLESSEASIFVEWK